MDDSVFRQPAPDQLSAFAQGDPVAIDEVICLVLPQLYRWALHQYSNLLADEVKSTIHQVLAEICRHPERYDPGRAKFTTYAINLIKMRLAGLHRSLKKIGQIEDTSQPGQEKPARRAYNQLDTEDLRIVQQQFFDVARDRLERAERDFLEQMLQGEKSQEVFVSILARYGPVSDPSAEVKNMKERLKRRLKAVALELGYEAEDLLEG
jgi:hypothetical protein